MCARAWILTRGARHARSIQIDPKKEGADVKRLTKARIVNIDEKIRTVEATKRMWSELTKLWLGVSLGELIGSQG